MDTFDKISETLNVETDIVKTEVISEVPVESKSAEDSTKDYEYTRGQLYSLIEKGQQAVNDALDVANSTDHPRAYEVAGQLIKNVADVTDKLIDLQKKMRDLDGKNSSPRTVNNSLFVGSTAELSKLIKQGILNNTDTSK
ncbi:terminase small subunit [Synechococcus phage DSL-LC03]|nr:terminase small subunit [Synechococcus phage DSL-LC03]